MDIIYTKNEHGERRAHIEIADHEVSDMLDDLKDSPDLFDAFAATRDFIGLLEQVQATFDRGRMADAREAEISRT